MRRSLTSGFLSVVSAKFATVTVTVLLTPILVRLLGSAAYGEYAFVIAVLGVGMILVNAGIFDGVRKFVAEERDEPHWTEHVLGYYLRLGGLLAGIGAGVVLALAWTGLVDPLLGSVFARYAVVIAGIVVARQLFQTMRGGLMGLGLERYSEPLVVARKVTFAIVGVSLAAVGWGVTGVLLGHLVASLLFGLVAGVLLARELDLVALLGRAPTGFPRRSLALFNLNSVVFILLLASLYHVDILLLLPLRGSQETGYYKAALLVAEFLWFVPFALQTVLVHSSAELWSNERLERITAVSARATRYTLTLTTVLAIGIAALASPFMRLYFGPEFLDASDFVVLLLPGALGFAVARPIFAIGQGKGQLRLLIAATGAAALLNLVLNLVLIPRYGASGAAVATSVGYGSMVVLHVAAARRLGFDPLADLRPVRYLLVAGLSGAVIYGLASVMPTPVSALIVVPVVGGTVYAVAALRIGLVDVAEAEEVLDGLPAALRGPLGWLLRLLT